MKAGNDKGDGVEVSPGSVEATGITGWRRGGDGMEVWRCGEEEMWRRRIGSGGVF